MDFAQNDNVEGPELDAQFDDGGTAATFILRGFGNRFDVRMFLQILAKGFAQNSHSAAMHHADARQSGKKSAVNEAFDLPSGVVDGLADNVDLGRNALAFVVERDGDATGPRRFHR